MPEPGLISEGAPKRSPVRAPGAIGTASVAGGTSHVGDFCDASGCGGCGGCGGYAKICLFIKENKMSLI